MSNELKVLTYNIHKGLAVANQRYILRDIESALVKVDPDIVILQEIIDSHSKHAERFSDWVDMPQCHFLADNGWPHVAFGENAVHRHGSHGNAVLSRYPIKKWKNINVTRNRFEQRGVLHTIIDTPHLSKPLHVCCVHLNLLNRDRERQLELLCNYVNSSIVDDEPLIIAGDFNDWRHKASDLLLQKIGVLESHSQVFGCYARTFPAWRPILNLDRIYYRNLDVTDAEVLNGKPWNNLSDHLPITTSFKATQSVKVQKQAVGQS